MVELNLNQMQIAKPLFLCAKHAVSDRRISVRAEKGRGICDELGRQRSGGNKFKWKRPGWWVLRLMIGTMPEEKKCLINVC